MSTKSAATPFGGFEWSVAWRYLGATQKDAGVSLIAIIALIGIALSVATMLVVMSVFEGFRVNLYGTLMSVNGHVFVESTEGPLTDYDDLTDRLLDVPMVEAVVPTVHAFGYAVGDTDGGAVSEDSGRPVELRGLSRDDLLAIPELTTYPYLLAGNFDTFGEGRNGGSEIAIGARLAGRLEVWVGDTITLITPGGAETPFGRSPVTQKTYQVGAIFSAGTPFVDLFHVYMPIEQARVLLRLGEGVSELEMRIQDPIDIRNFVARQRNAMLEAMGPGYTASDWRFRSPGAEIYSAAQVEGALMRVLMLMIVAVATLLIISGLVMLVKDKRSDVAVLRTMGASQGMVMRVFLLIGAWIGITGAALGVLLGMLIVYNIDAVEAALSFALGREVWDPEVYGLDEVPAVFQWGEVWIVLAFTLGLSFLSSVFPAWQASRLDPVEALRYE